MLNNFKIFKELRRSFIVFLLIPFILIILCVILFSKRSAKRIGDNIKTMKGYY